MLFLRKFFVFLCSNRRYAWLALFGFTVIFAMASAVMNSPSLSPDPVLKLVLVVSMVLGFFGQIFSLGALMKSH